MTFCASFSLHLSAQVVEITGEAKVSTMQQDDTQDNLVVRLPDGTLGTRAAASLPASFIDTTRTLNTDLELAKMLCDCPNLPPFLIEQLRDAGYSLEDLARAGVPYENLKTEFPVVDGSGNEYEYVTIGNQRWLASNLRANNYNNGGFISNYADSTQWANATASETPAYAWFENDQFNYQDPYGAMYNWYVVDSTANGGKNVCPVGWHIPTMADLDTLLNELQPGTPFDLNANSAANLLKFAGSDYWSTPIGNNLTGFSFPGGGYRTNTSVFVFLKVFGRFWLREPVNSSIGEAAAFRSLNPGLDKVNHNKGYGLSIRCMQRVQ